MWKEKPKELAMQIYTDYTKTYLLPPSIEDWIPNDHPVRFIREFVDSITLSAYGFEENISEEGRPSYSNNMLLKIWLYSYYEKIYSTRQIEKSCRNQMPMIWLTTQNTPDHNTIWRFFKKNKSKLKKIFKQTVQIAVMNNMVGFVLQAVDGTKIKADVSKDKLLYAPDLSKLLSKVDESIEKANKTIEGHDKTEKGRPTDRLPKKLYGKKNLQQLIQHGLEELKEEEKWWLKENLEQGLQRLSQEKRKKLNTTDKDCRFIKTKGGKDFYYNAQSMVDSKNQIILGAIATNEETDNHQLVKMIEEAKSNSGKTSKETLGDTGYFSGEELQKAEEGGYSVLVNQPRSLSRKPHGFRKEDFTYDGKKDCYICPQKEELKLKRTNKRKNKNDLVRIYQCNNFKACNYRHDCSTDKYGRKIERYEFENALQRQRERHKIKENKELLKTRSQIVEGVFGWIKHNGNFHRWLYRGLESVDAQWLLLCSAVNLRKLYSYWSKNKLVIS